MNNPKNKLVVIINAAARKFDFINITTINENIFIMRNAIEIMFKSLPC